jgi:hypothetical protein
MRLKTLNGAPLSTSLDFGEHALLDPSKCEHFDIHKISTSTASSTASLKWRALAPRNTRLQTGWSQPYLPRGEDNADASISLPDLGTSPTFPTELLTQLDTTLSFEEEPSVADDFLQQSLIFHDTLLSSQVAQDATADQSASSSSFLTTSFGTSISEMSSPSRIEGQTVIMQVPPKMTTAPIGTLPSAQHLRSIYPQTPTPNLLCVLTTNPERREVFVRRGGFKMDLCEITVADDTKSGFKVTFWLRPPRESNNEQSHAQQLLLQELERMKVGDILLLRNIALTSFRDVVYGQSLNPIIARARTTIDVLMKSSGVSVGQLSGLPVPVFETFTRVKRWARTHVAVNEGGSRKRKETSTAKDRSGKRRVTSPLPDDSLPPDTMEAV